MSSIDDVEAFLGQENGLAVVSTVQSDGRVLSSVVNCGVVAHPVTGERCVGFVSRGDAARLDHIRRGGAAAESGDGQGGGTVTVAVRRGWTWLGVTGRADLIGPDDDTAGADLDDEALRLLLRHVYQAAGGDHDDYDAYDEAMRAERRVVVLVKPDRIVGNP